MTDQTDPTWDADFVRGATETALDLERLAVALEADDNATSGEWATTGAETIRAFLNIVGPLEDERDLRVEQLRATMVLVAELAPGMTVQELEDRTGLELGPAVEAAASRQLSRSERRRSVRQQARWKGTR